MQIQQINKKKIQRKELLTQRRALSLAQKKRYSEIITTKILNLPEYQKADLCFMYASMPDEFQTRELLENALKAGKRVCLPYITNKDEKIMQATLINSLEELVEGTYGILTVDEKNIHIVNPEMIDLVLVPAVGFDRQGYRLGMGGGYYDRYIVKSTKAKLVGAIYHCQLVDKVVKDEHDIKVDILLTEQEDINIAR